MKNDRHQYKIKVCGLRGYLRYLPATRTDKTEVAQRVRIRDFLGEGGLFLFLFPFFLCVCVSLVIRILKVNGQQGQTIITC